jgi:hypothetical protein
MNLAANALNRIRTEIEETDAPLTVLLGKLSEYAARLPGIYGAAGLAWKEITKRMAGTPEEQSAKAEDKRLSRWRKTSMSSKRRWAGMGEVTLGGNALKDPASDARQKFLDQQLKHELDELKDAAAHRQKILDLGYHENMMSDEVYYRTRLEIAKDTAESEIAVLDFRIATRRSDAAASDWRLEGIL